MGLLRVTSRRLEIAMKAIFLLFLLLTLIPFKAATLTTNEIFVRLQVVIENNEGLEDLITDLENLENKELVPLLKEFDRTWPQLRDRYLKDHGDFVQTQYSGEAKTEANRRIRQFRKDFMMVYQLNEAAMKPLLKTKSMPAIKGLKKLIMPDAKEIFATAPLALDQQRKIVLILAKFRDAIVETAVLPDQEKAEKKSFPKKKKQSHLLLDYPATAFASWRKMTKFLPKKMFQMTKEKGSGKSMNGGFSLASMLS